MATANFICIKWGDKFPPYYVNRLFHGVLRNTARDARFICMTDDATGIDPGVEIIPLTEQPFEPRMREVLARNKRQGALRKVALFRRDLIDNVEGPVLGFDLDVVVTGSLDDLLDFAPGKVCMRHDWLERLRGRFGGHGSVFRFDPALHGYLFDELYERTEELMLAANCSEQKFTSIVSRERGDFEYFPDRWIASFKRDAHRIPPMNLLLEPRLPDDTRVMCFHGTPKMEEALVGYRGSHPIRWTRACSWLADNWID